MVNTLSSFSACARTSTSLHRVRSPLMHLAAAAALCAAFTASAIAQTPAPAPAAPVQEAATLQAHNRHANMDPAERAKAREQWMQKRTARHAERLTQLHQQLALAPAQEAAWSHFEQAMQPHANGTARLDRQGMRDLTTPERIDRMRALRAQRAAAMDARGDATKAFYAQLQPAQQKTFDHAGMGMMKHGHRMGHGARHGHEARATHSAS